MPLPMLLFDGECRFCRASVKMLQRIVGAATFHAMPSQELSDRALAATHITRAECSDYVIVIAPDGRTYRGADAINVILSKSPLVARAGKLIRLIPFALSLERAGYRYVSRHRSSISRVVFAFTRR